MFIQTQSTPNPLSLMFYPGKSVMEVGSADFPNARTAMTSPLAKSLFGIDGIVIFPLSSCFFLDLKLSICFKMSMCLFSYCNSLLTVALHQVSRNFSDGC